MNDNTGEKKKPNRSPESKERRKDYDRNKSAEKYAANPSYQKDYNKKRRQDPEFRAKQKAYMFEYSKNRRARILEWLNKIKETQGCENCGFNHPAALDFHHIDPSKKKECVATMVSSCLPNETILTEINKCILLCANCHRVLHWEERRLTGG